MQYATADELAGYLQKDLDTYTADQALELASAVFSRRARTWWAPQTSVHTTTAGTVIVLPNRPVTAVLSVAVNGVTLPVDYTLRRSRLYRGTGFSALFGDPWAYPPDEVAVTYTYGFAAPTDEVKAVVLETAAQMYDVPVGAVIGETIDDYAIRYAAAAGGTQLTRAAAELADSFRGLLVA